MATEGRCAEVTHLSIEAARLMMRSDGSRTLKSELDVKDQLLESRTGHKDSILSYLPPLELHISHVLGEPSVALGSGIDGTSVAASPVIDDGGSLEGDRSNVRPMRMQIWIVYHVPRW